MSNYDKTQKQAVKQTSSFENEELEEGGRTMAPPQFMLTAGGTDDNSQNQLSIEGKDKLTETPQSKIQKLLKGQLGIDQIDEILELLYELSSDEITNLWVAEESKGKIDMVFSHLELRHFLAYPREIAATAQALEAETRKTKIIEIFNNHKKKTTELETARVIALMQGLGSDLFSNPDHEAIFLDGLKSYRRYATALKEDVKADKKEEEEDGAEFTKKRTARQESITAVVAKIKAVEPKWGRLGITSSISPANAIEIVELLRTEKDNVRAEILRRYPDDISNVLFNIPQEYRGQLGFGIDPERGTDENSKQFVLEQLRKRETWDNSSMQVNRLGILLGMAIQGGYHLECYLILKPYILSPIIWKNPDILEKALFIFTDGKATEPEPLVVALVNGNRTEENAAILSEYGFPGRGWQKPDEVKDGKNFSVIGAIYETDRQRRKAKGRNRKEYKTAKKEAKEKAKASGEQFDPVAFDEQYSMTSGVGRLGTFAVMKGEDLNLIDFSLAELQHGLGGDIMGLRLDENADPTQFPNAGKIDAKLSKGNAVIHSDSLPFEGLDYEMGASVFQWDNGYMKDVDAEFIWDGDQKQDAEKKDEKQEAQSTLSIQDLLITNLRTIDKTALVIGRISVHGLHVRLNQGIDDVGPVVGGYGMNILVTIASQISNLLFLAMNSITTAIDPFMPDAKMAAGDAVSEMLLRSFASDTRLDIGFDAVEIDNIMSGSSDTMRKAVLGPSTIQVGGSMLELYERKVQAMEGKLSRSEEDEAKLAEYQAIVVRERANIAAHESRLLQLQEKLTHVDPTDENARAAIQEELRQEQAAGKLLIAASLQDLELISSYSDDGQPQYMPAPKGKIDLALELNAPTKDLDQTNRNALEIESTAGIFNQENQLPEASLNRDRLYVESDHPSLPDQLAELMGMNLNDIMPGWVGGKLEMHDNVWTVTASTPGLHLNQFPVIDGVTFEHIKPLYDAYFDLHDVTATIEICLNPLSEQKEKGLVPQRIGLRELHGGTLTGDNLQISTSGFGLRLEEASVLENVTFRNLSYDFGMKKLVPGETQFGADKLALQCILGNLGTSLIADIGQFKAESFEFANFHQEIADAKNPKSRTDIDRLAARFINGKGEGNSLQYEGSDLDFDAESLAFERSTEARKEQAANGKWETLSSTTTTRLKVKLPSFAAPSLHYGSGKDAFQIHGLDGAETQPANLKGILAEVTLTESFFKGRKDEKGEALPESRIESVNIDHLQIDAIEGNDFEVTIGGEKYQLNGQATLNGLFVNGLEMPMGDDQITVLHGSAGLSSAQLQELVMGMLHVKDTSSGAFFIRRLDSDRGYSYSVENLLGEVQQNDKPSYGPEITALDANLMGSGFSASGTVMDSGLITMDATLPDGMRIGQVNWHDSMNNFSIAMPEGNQATLGGAKATLEIKLRKGDEVNPIESIRIKTLQVDSFTAGATSIVYKGNSMYLSGQDATTLRNIHAKEIDYNLLSSKFSGKITADDIHTKLRAELRSELLKHFLSQPEINLGMFSFELDKQGNMEVGMESGDLDLMMGLENGECEDDKSPNQVETDELTATFAQIEEHLPFLILGATTITKPAGEGSALTIRTKNPRLQGLRVEGSEFVKDGQVPFVGAMELSGQVTGELFIRSTPKGLTISASELDDKGKSTGGGSLSVEKGSLLVNDFMKLLGPEEAEEPEEKEPFSEMKMATTTSSYPSPQGPQEKQEPVKTEADYFPSRRFNVLNRLVPTDEGGGNVEISFLGGQAVIPIESVEKDGQRLGGYVDINGALEQLKEPIQKIILDQYSLKVGASLLKAYKRSYDTYSVGIKFLDYEILDLATKLESESFFDLDGRELIRLSDIVDFQTFKAALPAEEPAPLDPRSEYIDVIMAIAKYVKSTEFKIKINGLKISSVQPVPEFDGRYSLGETPGYGVLDSLFDPKDKSGLEMSAEFGFYEYFHKGPHFELTNFKAPGILKMGTLESKAFSSYRLSTSSTKFQRASANIEDLRSPETQLDLEGIDLGDFRIHLDRRQDDSKGKQ